MGSDLSFARSVDLPTTVMALHPAGRDTVGIDSVMFRIDSVRELWHRLLPTCCRLTSSTSRTTARSRAPGQLRTIVVGGVTGATPVVVNDVF